MDKEKVIKLADVLDKTISGSFPSISAWSDIGHAFDKLNSELNSKSVMPKVFADWYEEFGTAKTKALRSLGEIIEGYTTSEADDKLRDWLISGNQLERYQMCVDAIIHGYEVINNE